MDDKVLKISKSLSETIFDSNFSNIAKDLAEVTIDSAIVNETISNIPVFNTLHNLVNVAGTIKDNLFSNKLRKLLVDLNSVGLLDASKMRADYKDEKKRNKMSVLLLNILDDIKREECIDILSKLFFSLLNEDLTEEEFSILSEVINGIQDEHLSILNQLKGSEGPLFIQNSRTTFLVLHSLISIDFTPHNDGEGFRYVINGLGVKLLNSLTNKNNKVY